MLRIREWSKHFENNRTRELKRMDWVPIPNKMDGEGYTKLVGHPAGAAYLGAWLAIVEIASRRDPRGTLPWEGAEIPQALARISRLPATIFQEVIPILLEIQWLEQVGEKSQEGAEIPQDGAALRARVPFPSLPSSSIPAVPDFPKIAPKVSTPISTGLVDEFQKWLEPWPRCADPDSAARAWLSVVETPADLKGAFEARDRYLMSDEVARAVIMEPAKFLFAQKTGKWAGKWPPVQYADERRRRPTCISVRPEDIPAATPDQLREALRWSAENDLDPEYRKQCTQELERLGLEKLA